MGSISPTSKRIAQDEGSTRGIGLSLAVKLNIIVIAAIILVSVGLVSAGYWLYSKEIDEDYRERMENASNTGSYMIDPDAIAYLWDCMQTEEFEEVRQRAVRENDPSIIEDWLGSVDATKLETTDGAPEGNRGHVFFTYQNLDDIFEIHCNLATSLAESADIQSAYIQYMQDGVTYNLVDPDLGYLGLGSIEEPLPEFAEYGDNEEIPPTIFSSKYGFLCTTAIPIYSDLTGEPVAMFCFDADMNEAMVERHSFLVNCISYVLMITLLALAASLFLVRRIATRPLRQLTEATSSFGETDESYEEGDIIELDIRSNDEIGALYREIRDMQVRITDYTHNLARITAEDERVKTELWMATAIQKAVMPDSFPDRPEFDIYASMNPARDVGGDFYDFFLVDDNHLCLAIGDVSGKGIPAALFMMAVKTMLDDHTLMGGTPAEILAQVNRRVCEHNTTKTFTTIWLGILDIETGELVCANAGHNYPWVRGADGTFKMLRDKHSLVVGGVKSMKYTDYSIELAPGDAIFVHTDGVTEAVNPAHEFFGADRLNAALNRSTGANPEQAIRTVQAEVDAFADGAEWFDDLTMLCMEYHGSANARKGVSTTDGKQDDEADTGEKELTLPAVVESIPRAIGFVTDELNSLQCPKMQIVVAIDELLGNIAKFAYGSAAEDVTVRFRAMQDGDTVEITFIDRGRPFNPLEADDPDVTLEARKRKVGGLGIFLVKKTMDEVEYERENGCNILRIRKRMTR